MRFLAAIFSRQGFVVLFLSAVLAACTVVVDDGPGPRPRPPRPGPQFCTKQYEPVCARRGGDRQTFANACLADRAGYRIVRDGPCRDGGEGGGEQTFCTREYAPVCAPRGG
ncbi:Kazal-type serine protease inhibitor family protein, partial [Mesorhizobium sp. B264B1A]|uniref:Kazal-type serine protease inhibitor family protein n=1 Tax=Mesorhizobium sp. B264B1A TaxID=2876668 RepID=UPI001CCFE2C2